MTLINLLVLAGIVSAFTAFALVLAWGDRQTRHLRSRAGAEPQAQDTEDDVKRAA